MATKKWIFIVFSFLLLSCNTRYNTAKWMSSVDKNRGDEQRNQLLTECGTNDEFDADIRLDEKQQVFEGFGGCFNELGWEALKTLTQKKRDDVIEKLFDHKYGLNLAIGRVPIGANDYSKSYYSLNDSANDYLMQFFSIERDKKSLIPYIKEALKFNPNLKVWASPWTPPIWMKENKHYACASDWKYNNLKKANEGHEGDNMFIMNDTMLLAYTLYFANFIKAYKDEGIPLYAIQVQNEFNSCQIFPSCTWSAPGLSRFIGDYLGPGLERKKMETEIWLGTIERPDIAIVDTILGNDRCRKYIKGLGFQWGGKGAVCEADKKYPNLPKMQTESECGNGDNSWADAEFTFSLIKHYLNCGVNSYMYWNMVLDETGKRKWGWKQNALITINRKEQRAILNPEFYLLKHFSAVQPGAVKLNVTGEFSDILAFKNPDKNIVIIATNLEKSEKKISIRVNNKLLKVELAPKSFNTFIVIYKP